MARTAFTATAPPNERSTHDGSCSTMTAVSTSSCDSDSDDDNGSDGTDSPAVMCLTPPAPPRYAGVDADDDNNLSTVLAAVAGGATSSAVPEREKGRSRDESLNRDAPSTFEGCRDTASPSVTAVVSYSSSTSNTSTRNTSTSSGAGVGVRGSNTSFTRRGRGGTRSSCDDRIEEEGGQEGKNDCQLGGIFEAFEAAVAPSKPPTTTPSATTTARTRCSDNGLQEAERGRECEGNSERGRAETGTDVEMGVCADVDSKAGSNGGSVLLNAAQEHRVGGMTEVGTTTASDAVGTSFRREDHRDVSAPSPLFPTTALGDQGDPGAAVVGDGAERAMEAGTPPQGVGAGYPPPIIVPDDNGAGGNGICVGEVGASTEEREGWMLEVAEDAPFSETEGLDCSSTPADQTVHPPNTVPRISAAFYGAMLPSDDRSSVAKQHVQNHGASVRIAKVESWSNFGEKREMFSGGFYAGGSKEGEGQEEETAVLGRSTPEQRRSQVEGAHRLEEAFSTREGNHESDEHLDDDEFSLESDDDDDDEKATDEERALAAAQAGDIDAVEAFLDRGGGVEVRDSRIGMTLLSWAARCGHAELARFLLSKGASAKSEDKKNRTPLHRACTGCNASVVEVLLDHGADPNARDETWRTPLHRAARWGSPECSTLLLDAGADIEARDKELARTPLHFASRSGQLETTRVLLNNGADLNAKSVAGNTPLHLACDRGLVGNVTMLKEWGADTKAKNEAGAIPAEVAAPWVEDSVKLKMQELLADSNEQYAPSGGEIQGVQYRPQPAVVRPRPKGAAEQEAGLIDSIRSKRTSMADCPECQQNMPRQTYTLHGDGAPGEGTPVEFSSTHKTPYITSLAKGEACAVHRLRAQPGEGGLPGLSDDELGSDFVAGAISSIEGREEEFRPRKGLGRSRKNQLSRRYEGSDGSSGCCSLQ